MVGLRCDVPSCTPLFYFSGMHDASASVSLIVFKFTRFAISPVVISRTVRNIVPNNTTIEQCGLLIGDWRRAVAIGLSNRF